MGFRDEDEAVRARADALARELADRDARVAELEAKLAEKAAKLAERDAALEAEAAEAREAEQAEARLEALRERGAAKAKERAAAEQAREAEAAGEEEREREARRLASVSAWGSIDLVSILPLLAVPTVIGSLWLMPRLGAFPFWLPIAAGLAALLAKYGGRAWARRGWTEEEAWARGLPYELAGYPALLAEEPSSMRSTPILHLDGSRHQILQLELRFADEAPDDLDALVKAFDAELDATNPADAGPLGRMRAMRGEAEPAPPHPIYFRASPVSFRTTKHGSKFVVTEHNRAVRAWVRRLEEELLRPLHARHRLARVTVRLR